MRVCQICSDINRIEIDRAVVKGGNISKIAKEYSVPYQSLYNHAQRHVSHQLVAAYQKKNAIERLNLLSEIEELLHRTKAILDTAESEGKLGIALKAIAEARGSYELLSKIAFSLHQARVSELELERVQDGTAEIETEEEFQERLSVLSYAEIEMLEKLIEKIERQDSRMVVISDKSSKFAHTVTRQFEVTIDESEEVETKQQKPRFRRTKPPANPNRIRPIKSKRLEPYSEDAGLF